MNEPYNAVAESLRNPRHDDHVPSAPPPATPMLGPASSHESPPAQYEAQHGAGPGGNGWPAAPGMPPVDHQVGTPPASLAHVPVPVFPAHGGVLERLGVTADDFSSRRVVPPRPPVAETGLRGALHRFSFGMVALPPGPRERSRQRAVDTVRVLVTGSPDFRARRIMAGMSVDEKAALKTVERTDAERSDWYRRFYETGWLTPWTYDLCISTDHLNPEQGAEIVVGFAALR